MAGEKFEELEHTADAGLRVFGDDLGEILVHAAQGMFSLIGRVSFEERDLADHRWEIAYATPEEALQRWLQELLLDFDLHGFFPVTTSVEVRPGRIAAVARGGTFDPARDELRSELKAVTQHGLRVRRTPRGGLEAEVIFDV
ncbi:MAG: archease [Candidatus Binatia bacterium]|jgi:SHS2 domain-containing protein